MSQLNLKQILAGDNLSTVVDKLNYNFNQIVLNGGGPQGMKGIMGVPGLPGAQGSQGLPGPKGETGSHIYSDGATPGGYPFGSGGEILPRIGDIFIETNTSYLRVWELNGSVLSSSWDIVQTITAPGGTTKTAYDYTYNPTDAPGQASVALNASAVNDPNQIGKFLIGSSNALLGSFVIDQAYDISSPETRLVPELSSGANFADSLLTVAGSRNQLRLLDSNRDSATRLTKGGGIVHSVVTTGANQFYKILNGDNNGFNHFSLSLNNSTTSNPTLLYGDTNNKLGVGVSELTPLIASAVVNGGLAVGSVTTGFYLPSNGASLDNGIGAIIEGNVSIGRNKNNLHNLGVYNKSTSFPGVTMAVDTTESASTQAAVSDILLGSNLYTAGNVNTSTKKNYWRIRHDGYSAPGNTNYKKFTLTGFNETASYNVSRNSLTIGLTHSSSTVASTQVSIDSTDTFDKFQVGNIAIGTNDSMSTAGFMSSHLSFNMQKSPISDSWRQLGNGTYNGASTIWSSNFSGLGYSIFKSAGGSTVSSGITDATVFGNTRFYISSGAEGNSYLTGSLTLSETRNAYSISKHPFRVDFGALGTTGSSSGSGSFRRDVAIFGDGPNENITISGTTTRIKYGSPMISATNDVVNNDFSRNVSERGVIGSVVPQYTWYGNSLSGLYLSAIVPTDGFYGSLNELETPPGTATVDFVTGSTSNPFTFSTGLAIEGRQAFSIIGNSYRARVGFFQNKPLETFQIGDKFVYHDSNNNSLPSYIGYNVCTREQIGNFSNNTLNPGEYRIFGDGATGATQEGAFRIKFYDNPRQDGWNGLTNYSSIGGKLALVPDTVGSSTSKIPPIVPITGSKVARAVVISPPPAYPVGVTGFANVSSSVPQVSIGLNTLTPADEKDSATSGKRGTLSIAQQMRMKPATAAVPPAGPFGVTIEDQYNIGLYGYDGTPGSAIYTSAYEGGGKKGFGISFLGSGGNAVSGDVPLLYADIDSALVNTHQRIATFGAGFRVGINTVPVQQTGIDLTSDYHDLAALTIGAYYEGINTNEINTKEGTGKSIIAKGAIVLQQAGLFFRDPGINPIYGGNPSIPTNGYPVGTYRQSRHYAGDWAIRYSNIGTPNNPVTGLKFIQPSTPTKIPLHLDDAGSVGINLSVPAVPDFYLFKTGFNGGNNASVMGPGYGAGQPSSADDGSTDNWSAIGYVNSVPVATRIDGSSGSYRWRAALAVHGITKQTGLINVSDSRMKNEIARVKDGSALEKILKLDPVLYSWKEEYYPDLKGKVELGLFAQEVLDVMPEAVVTSKTSNFEDEHALEYNTVFTTMISAIKDLNKIVDQKDETIKNLEAKLSKIEELLAKNGIK